MSQAAALGGQGGPSPSPRQRAGGEAAFGDRRTLQPLLSDVVDVRTEAARYENRVLGGVFFLSILNLSSGCCK